MLYWGFYSFGLSSSILFSIGIQIIPWKYNLRQIIPLMRIDLFIFTHAVYLKKSFPKSSLILTSSTMNKWGGAVLS